MESGVNAHMSYRNSDPPTWFPIIQLFIQLRHLSIFYFVCNHFVYMRDQYAVLHIPLIVICQQWMCSVSIKFLIGYMAINHFWLDFWLVIYAYQKTEKSSPARPHSKWWHYRLLQDNSWCHKWWQSHYTDSRCPQCKLMYRGNIGHYKAIIYYLKSWALAKVWSKIWIHTTTVMLLCLRGAYCRHVRRNTGTNIDRMKSSFWWVLSMCIYLSCHNEFKQIVWRNSFWNIELMISYCIALDKQLRFH